SIPAGCCGTGAAAGVRRAGECGWYDRAGHDVAAFVARTYRIAIHAAGHNRILRSGLTTRARWSGADVRMETTPEGVRLRLLRGHGAVGRQYVGRAFLMAPDDELASPGSGDRDGGNVVRTNSCLGYGRATL